MQDKRKLNGAWNLSLVAFNGLSLRSYATGWVGVVEGFALLQWLA
jgi:hypothetical protein